MIESSEHLKKIVEGALLAAGEALTVERLLTLFEEHEKPEKSDVQSALVSIQEDCVSRGYALVEVASGWRFQVEPELAQWVNRLWEEKPQKYSRALLETLALIAYRQPLTRSDIEEVRGVAVSSHIIKTLAEREWIKVVGHRDVPGRPSLYATTKQFLDYFGLKSLDELPTLGELKDIDSLNAKLELEEETTIEQEQIAEALEDGVRAELAAGELSSSDSEVNLDGDFSEEKEQNAERSETLTSHPLEDTLTQDLLDDRSVSEVDESAGVESNVEDQVDTLHLDSARGEPQEKGEAIKARSLFGAADDELQTHSAETKDESAISNHGEAPMQSEQSIAGGEDDEVK